MVSANIDQNLDFFLNEKIIQRKKRRFKNLEKLDICIWVGKKKN